MTEGEKPQKIEFNKIMLAMDVVDTLRHERTLVERELQSDEYDQALIEKIRQIYKGQGLEVSDEIIAEGVAALREDRFTYRPPKRSLKVVLAHLYVNRARWVKRGALLTAALVVAYLLYQFVYVSPTERGHQKEAHQINLTIGAQQDQVSVAKERLDNLKNTLAKAQSGVRPSDSAASKELLGRAAQQISAAEDKIRAFDKLSLNVKLDSRNVTELGDSTTRRLEQRAELISALTSHLDSADAAIASLGQLQVLPAKLADQRDHVISEAREKGVSEQAEKLYRDAMAALQQGDVKTAEQRYASLQHLYNQLVLEYQLRIVSRPGTPSGVWRYPKDNSAARNYYLIINAVNRDGQTLTIPVTSEEDGRTRLVSVWGLRVSESVFEQVKRDKQDDGIINRNVVGTKERGYLQPKYLIPTTGGTITQW